MRKVALALAAAVAALSFTAPAGAQVTNYAVTGPNAAGSFSLDYDNGTSTYSLTALDLIAGTPFGLADGGIGQKNSFVDVTGGLNGGALTGDMHAFILSFQPSLGSQTGFISYNDAGVVGIQGGPVSITEGTTIGSRTSYGVSGPDAVGTFSLDLDFVNGQQVYSLSALDLLVGTPFELADGEIGQKNSIVDVAGGLNGGALGGDMHAFILTFFPTLDTQSAFVSYNDAGVDGIQGGPATVTRFVASVSAVPEPASWAMMLLGFAGIGLAMRRKAAAALA